MANHNGLPQYCAYSGKSILNICGILTKILDHVLACGKAPAKSSCFTWTLSLAACAKNILSAQKEAVGEHLSSMLSLIYRSPLTPIWTLSLSRLPSIIIFTLKISMSGMLTSPFSNESMMKVCASTRVFNSFLTVASHALFTTPSGIFRISLMVHGTGSQEWASSEDGINCWCASATHASKSSKSLQGPFDSGG